MVTQSKLGDYPSEKAKRSGIDYHRERMDP